MIYYPKNKIQTNLSTNGSEYQLISNYNLNNGIYYVGYYYKLYNEETYTGKFPGDGNNDKLIFIGVKPPKPQPKSITPKSIPPLFPTEDDYKNGSFIRYFFKKRNEYLFKEIKKDELNNIDKNLYITFNLKWVLTGVEETVFNTNRNITLLTEQKNNVYGLSLFLNMNYLQYYKFLPKENLYTNGNELMTPDGKVYFGPYHIHPDKGYMVGATHVETYHSLLIPIKSNMTTPMNTMNNQPTINNINEGSY